MNSIAGELKRRTDDAPSLSYSLLFPPGWGRYGVDRAAEEQLLDNARQIYKDAGRPALAADVRTRIHVHFARARRIGAQSSYLPNRRVDDVVLPVSIMSVPYRVSGGGTLQGAVSRMTSSRVTQVPLSSGPAFRWEETRDRVEREEGASAKMISYLIPVPGPDPAAAIVLTYAILHLTGDEGTDFATVLEELFDAIVGTFRWRQS